MMNSGSGAVQAAAVDASMAMASIARSGRLMSDIGDLEASGESEAQREALPIY
jgi:hypothetical protein